MSQGEINDREWANADNWSGPRWMSLYFSKRDTRLFVPKRMPWMGWTLNMGHSAGAVSYVLILVIVALLPILVILFAERGGP